MAARSLAVCLCLAVGAPAVVSEAEVEPQAASSSSCGTLDEQPEDECEVHGVHFLQAKRELVPRAPLASEQRQRGPGERSGAANGSQGKAVGIKDVHSVVVELVAAKMNLTAEDVDSVFEMLDKDGDGNLDEDELLSINRSVVDEDAVAPLNGTAESLTAANTSRTQSTDLVTFLSSEIGSRIYSYR